MNGTKDDNIAPDVSHSPYPVNPDTEKIRAYHQTNIEAMITHGPRGGPIDKETGAQLNFSNRSIRSWLYTDRSGMFFEFRVDDVLTLGFGLSLEAVKALEVVIDRRLRECSES